MKRTFAMILLAGMTSNDFLGESQSNLVNILDNLISFGDIPPAIFILCFAGLLWRGIEMKQICLVSFIWQIAFVGSQDRAIKGNGGLRVQNRDDCTVLPSVSVFDCQIRGESRKGGCLDQCGKGFILFLNNELGL